MDNYIGQIDAISRLLEQRARVYPVQDSSYTHLQSALRVFADALLADIDCEHYPYDEGLIARALQLSEAPVFICGSMKSGTTLLVQLLDHHANLLVMPGDSNCLRVQEQWDRTQFREIASHWVSRIVNPTGQEPFWFLGEQENTFRAFLCYLHYFLRISTKDVFLCAVMSLYAVRSMVAAGSRERFWVEKTPHNELRVRQLLQMFPNARFIHVLRNPLDTIASLRRLYAYRGWEATVLDHVRCIKTLFNAAQANIEIAGTARYLIIKYEDLTSNPEHTMDQVARFLGIPFDPVFLIPTQNGRPAVANSMFPEGRVIGRILKRDRSESGLSELSERERQTIVSGLHDEAVRAGYRWDAAEMEKYRKTGLAFVVHTVNARTSDFAQKARARLRRTLQSRRTAVRPDVARRPAGPKSDGFAG